MSQRFVELLHKFQDAEAEFTGYQFRFDVVECRFFDEKFGKPNSNLIGIHLILWTNSGNYFLTAYLREPKILSLARDLTPCIASFRHLATDGGTSCQPPFGRSWHFE